MMCSAPCFFYLTVVGLTLTLYLTSIGLTLTSESKRQTSHRLAGILKPCENTPKIKPTSLESNRVG